MNISTRQEENACVIEVDGVVNIASAPDLLQSMKTHFGKGVGRAIVDLKGVDYMDSSGVGVLVTGLKQANALNIPFGICGVAERVCSVLRLTRLDSLFKIFPDTETALQELA